MVSRTVGLGLYAVCTHTKKTYSDMHCIPTEIPYPLKIFGTLWSVDSERIQLSLHGPGHLARSPYLLALLPYQ